MEIKCYVPQIKDLETAIRIYYSNSHIGSSEIKELFGYLSGSKIASLKNAVRDEMKKRNIMQYSLYTVDVEVAYEVWGISIEALERKYNKLKKLGLV